MKIDLEGKVALVTAGSRGIGLGAAQALRHSGAKIAICGRDEASLRNAEQALGGPSPEVFSLPGDIGDAPFLERLVAGCSDRLGPIDVLVNNNGGPPAGDTFGFSDEQWQGAIDRNLLSAVRLCALVAPGMKERGWGRIINITSLTAKEPGAGMVLSNVTRAGVAAYSKTLARELGPHGVTVNTILVGACLTDRLVSLIEKGIGESGKSLEEAISETAETIPVRYIPKPDEFANHILFLASREAAFLTGTAIPLDGGISRSTF